MTTTEITSPALNPESMSATSIELKYNFLKGAYSFQNHKMKKLKMQIILVSALLVGLAAVMTYLVMHYRGLGIGFLDFFFWGLVAVAAITLGYAISLVIYFL